MAKMTKTTLYFLTNEPLEKLHKLLEEFPEIKLTGPRLEEARNLVYYEIKYPVTDRDIILRYLQSKHIAYF